MYLFIWQSSNTIQRRGFNHWQWQLLRQEPELDGSDCNESESTSASLHPQLSQEATCFKKLERPFCFLKSETIDKVFLWFPHLWFAKGLGVPSSQLTLSLLQLKVIFVDQQEVAEAQHVTIAPHTEAHSLVSPLLWYSWETTHLFLPLSHKPMLKSHHGKHAALLLSLLMD